MNYYQVLYDHNHSEGLMFLLIDEKALPFKRYDVEKEHPVQVDKVVCSIDPEQTEYCDYIANDLIWLIVSQKAKTIIESMNIGNTRFIEVVDQNNGRVVGYLVHCMNYLDAFDEENAVCSRYSDGRPMVIKYALCSERIKEADLFKIKGHDFAVFISNRLKQALQKNNCIGFDYLKIKS